MYNTNKSRTTTLSCDYRTRDVVSKIAEQKGVTHREALAEIVRVYAKNNSTKTSAPDQQGSPPKSRIPEYNNDRVIGFIKKQEELFLQPMMRKIDEGIKAINTLLSILKEM